MENMTSKGTRKTHRKKTICAIVLIALLLGGFFLSPLSNYPVSLAVMKVYSHVHWRDSVMEKQGIDLEIPGGTVTAEEDWYPFVMAFNDTEGFRRFTGRDDLELTILYNFPAFDVIKGCSRLYDPRSPYYNGFYGAYLVSGEGTPYGFLPDGRLDTASVAEVPKFDLQRLVLADFGLADKNMIFDWRIEDITENVPYAGSDDWTRVDAELTVNGTWHVRQEFHRSYLQYGSPRYEAAGAHEADGTALPVFAPVKMLGRVYGKYFDNWNTSVFFYVLASDRSVLEDCDERILSKSTLAG